MSNHALSRAAGFCLLVVMLTGLSGWWVLTATRASAIQTLSTQLGSMLPAGIARAGINSFSDSEFERLLIAAIDADLAAIEYHNAFQMHCAPQVIALDGYSNSPLPAHTGQFNLQWREGELLRSLDIGVRCELNQVRLWGGQFGVSLLFSCLLAFLPRPRSAQSQRRCAALQQAGIAASACESLCADPALKTVADTELPWVSRAIQLGYPVDVAINAGKASACLRFDVKGSRVSVHGLWIDLPATPFIYYYWYASCRLQSREGWFTNPAAKRPDLASAQQLIAMMENHGGHRKAINDLYEKGLRAKILDQNRSKIKDELCHVLGDELAQEYLFEGIRDKRTARYRYRLRLPPERIILGD